MLLAFYFGSGLIGAAIRAQTRGKYSHAAVMLPEDGSVIEAWQKGGVLHNPTPFTLHGDDALIDLYEIKGLTVHTACRAERFLRSQVGAKYDFIGVLRFLSHVNRNNYARWFCSELAAEAFEEAGRPLLNTEAWRISPVALSWSTELELKHQRVGIDWWQSVYGGGEASALEEVLP